MAVDSSPLVVRHPDFGLTTDTAVAWSPRRPEFACAANSVSLLMPHMEPYFVRTVAAAVPHLESVLQDRARAFCGQEAEHHRQHGVFNRLLVARHPRLGLVERVAARL
ncbi:MAG: metal-dependent hydrolase, partial [Acidimicrobiia bacterium]|nr:metal-dependent hydrolase [Acidimicrobiia bacterium]